MMKKLNKLLILALLVLTAVACDKEETAVAPAPEDAVADAGSILMEEQEIIDILGLENDLENASGRFGNPHSMVYTLSNEAAGNRVIAFRAYGNGQLEMMESYPTGGTGTDGGLGNQGALALSKSGKLLYAINAGSNELSVFYVFRNGSLYLIDTVPSEGEMPISVTSHRGIAYVLNAGGTGNIAGFGFNWHGELVLLPNSIQPLSSDMAGGAQISFSPNGRALVVTEKATNMITSYKVGHWGSAGSPEFFPSAGVTPFGFTFGNSSIFYVTETSGGAAGQSTVSSYYVNNAGQVSLIDGPFATGGSAACWVTATTNGRGLFVTNTAGDDISSLAVEGRGNIAFANDGMTTPSFDGPIDAIVDRNSKFLYTLTGGNDAIHTYRIGHNGSLEETDLDDGLPVGSTGLVVR